MNRKAYTYDKEIEKESKMKKVVLEKERKKKGRKRAVRGEDRKK